MAEREGIFPTFFLSGFECSTFVWQDKGRRNLVAETRHAEHVDEDYAFLRGLGIAVAREGIPGRSSTKAAAATSPRSIRLSRR